MAELPRLAGRTADSLDHLCALRRVCERQLHAAAAAATAAEEWAARRRRVQLALANALAAARDAEQAGAALQRVLEDYPW